VHRTRIYDVADERGRSYPVFALGSPFYLSDTNGGRGHFAVFRLGAKLIEAADVSWLPANPVPDYSDGLDLWTDKRLAEVTFQTATIFADGWGGWRFTRSSDGRCGP
jgi:hypothetical protein